MSDVPDPDRLPFTPLRELGLIGISADLHVSGAWHSSSEYEGADDVHLRFNDGVTALYGPNGVGKSRVLTAVREALDPTAQHLRFSSIVFMRETACDVPMDSVRMSRGMAWEAAAGPCENLLASAIWEQRPELAAEISDRGLLAMTVSSGGIKLGAAASQDPTDEKAAAALADLRSQVLAPFEEKRDLKRYFGDSVFFEDRGDEIAESWVDTDAYRDFLRHSIYTDSPFLWELVRDEPLIPDEQWALRLLDPRRPSFLPLPLAQFRADRRAFANVKVLELDDLGEGIPQFQSTAVEIAVQQMAACAELADKVYRLLLSDAPPLAVWVPNAQEWRLGQIHSNSFVVRNGDDAGAFTAALNEGSFRWTFGIAPSWVAEDRSGAYVRLDELSATQERWAKLAIALAWQVLRARGDLPGVAKVVWNDGLDQRNRGLLLLCDEPEAGLPIQAQKRLSRGLKRLTDEFGITVITATHSGVMLEEPSVTPVRLDRDDESGDSYRVVATQVEPDERDRLRSAGVPPSELLHLYRTLLVVEGRHDEWLIDELIGDELADLGVKVVPAHGTAQTARFFATEAGFLFDHLPDLNFVIAFDSVRHDVAVEMYLAASDAADHAERMQRLDDIVRRHGKASPEEGTLRTLLDRASEQGRFERIGGLHGFSEPDIIDYLNCDQVLPGRTWEDLRAEHDEARSTRKGIPGDFKRYLGITYDVEFNEELIRSAAPRDSIPDDFTLLLERCQLATRPSD